jgi:Domain of unknown function (DUF4386)
MPLAIAGNQVVRTPARQMARIAGALYLAIVVTSIYGFYRPKTRLALHSSLVALAAFVIVVVLLYFLFKSVSRSVSFVASLFGMAGSALGILNSLHLAPFRMSNLVLFAFYCILIGTLIVRSSFMPRFVGVLMVIAGLGYLTLLWPALGRSLNPWNLIPGGVGELTLAVWLLVKGVDQQRWIEQSTTAAAH